MTGPRRAIGETVLLASALAGLVAGGVLWWAGADPAADAVCAAVTVLGIVPGVWWVVRAARDGRLGVDVIAVLAQVGTLVVGEFLAGAIITVMLASGRMLEARAGARAERDLRSLVDRAPRTVHRYTDGGLAEPPLDQVVPGDLVLVRPGEVLAVDGLVESDVAVLDEAALTSADTWANSPAATPTSTSGAAAAAHGTPTSTRSPATSPRNEQPPPERGSGGGRPPRAGGAGRLVAYVPG